MDPKEITIRITAPWFVAGVVIEEGKVVRAAPIVKYMVGWPKASVIKYSRGRGWLTRSSTCQKN
jgi:hypothetical protein